MKQIQGKAKSLKVLTCKPGQTIAAVLVGTTLAVTLAVAPAHAGQQIVELTGKTPDWNTRESAIKLAINNATKNIDKECRNSYQVELSRVSHRCWPREENNKWVKCEVTLACKPVSRRCKQMYCGTEKALIKEIVAGE